MLFFGNNFFAIIIINLLLLFLTTSKSIANVSHSIKSYNHFNKENMVFEPPYIKISVGDKINFIPSDEGHNFKSIFVPIKASNWNSKNNQIITIKFDIKGIYIYECTNHNMMAMIGIIQVGDDYDIKKVNNFIDNYSKKFVLNKDRLKRYFYLLAKNNQPQIDN